MRIIAGEARGRILKAPKGLDTRPTSDKIKGSLFNILGDRIYRAMVLDLYAGTGSLGLEAISRGARFAYFIERDGRAIASLNTNIENCGFFERTKVIRRSVKPALTQLIKDGILFDIILADPPYGDEENFLTIMDKSFNLLANNGIVILEEDFKTKIDLELKNLELFDQRRYGRTAISFYRRR